MGISKARGIAWAKRHLGRGGRVVVMTGDGELQEGQNWEALQAAAHQQVGRLLVVVDRNELQSDKTTEEILALESLEAKLTAFGARVVTCDGHDHTALRDAFRTLWGGDDGTPGVLVARTIKGKGVSFMEHPAALAGGRWDVPLARGRSRRRGVRGRRGRAAGASRRGLRAARAGAARDGRGASARRRRHEPPGRAGERRRRADAAARGHATRSGRVRRGSLRRGASRARRARAAARRARRRPRLRLPGARVRARRAGAVRRERDRRAGHGLDGGGHGPARARPRR